jgi:ABC-2 type transport system permease protein
VVLPVVALVFGTGAFGAEIEDGTLAYLLTKPISRIRIGLAKLAAAAGLTALFGAGSTLLAGLIAYGGIGPDGIVLGFTAAVAAGSVVYCSLFMALRFMLKRAVVAGLGYIVVWEGLASNTFAGSRSLSVNQYVLSIADNLSSVSPDLFQATLPIATAVQAAIIALLATTAFSLLRLRSLELQAVE